jgi:hypothetical protein
MEKCHLIEVILSCIWHMFVPSTEQDKQDDDDDENILKIHPLACMYRQKLHLHTREKKFACDTVFNRISMEVK